MGLIYTIFTVLLTLVTIYLLVVVVLRPSPVKLLIRQLHPNAEYKPNAKTSMVTEKYTLYSRPTSKHDKLIVVFMGGCGLFSHLHSIYGITNWLDDYLGEHYDVVTFSYPTRFKHTIHDSMLSINRSLMDFINYETVHVVGVSFGVLLAGAFYQKETSLEKSTAMNIPQIGLKFKSFIALSGLFELTFNARLITNIVDYYIMRNVPAKIHYTCYSMLIPKLVISSYSDFLVAQTVKFCSIEQQSTECKVYDTATLPHAFTQFTNLPEAVDSLKRIAAFIHKVDGGNIADIGSGTVSIDRGDGVDSGGGVVVTANEDNRIQRQL